MQLLRHAFLVILPIFFSLHALANISEQTVPENEQLRAALIGTWGNSDDEGRTFWAFDEYFPDGRLIATGTLPENGKSFRAVANFQTKGRLSCVRVTETSDPSIFPLGLYFCSEVLYIDNAHVRFKDLDSGKEFTLYRVLNK